MDGFSVSIDSSGFDEVFGRAKQNIARAIDLSLRQSALAVQNRAKGNAPFLTGNLRRSITHIITKGIATIGTNVVYAKEREFNTRRKPRGYLRPALKDSTPQIKGFFETNLNNALSS